MKHLHPIMIMSRKALQTFLCTHFKSGATYHDIDEKWVVLSGEHKDQGTEDEVRAHTEVFHLPDVLDSTPIDNQHAEILKPLGVKRSSSAMQVRQAIRLHRKNF